MSESPDKEQVDRKPDVEGDAGEAERSEGGTQSQGEKSGADAGKTAEPEKPKRSKPTRGGQRGGQRGRGAPEPSEDDGPIRYRLPDPTRREMFGIADQLLGASKMIVMCEDGKSRMARIPGKMKRRMWIKPGDLVIVKPWDIQDDKADVRYRYIRNQAVNMSRRGLVPDLLDSFS